MNDTIYRQAAIDVMLMAIDDDWESDYATDRMNELSSAEPERFNPCTVCQEFDCSGCKFKRSNDTSIRKISRWSDFSDSMYCLECGKELMDYFSCTEDGSIREQPNFCPNCGAYMRKGKK